MTSADFINVLIWHFAIFSIGLLFFFPSRIIFSHFYDKGYIFAKSLGLSIVSYVLFILGSIKLLPFSTVSIYAILSFALVINIYFFRKKIKFEKGEIRRYIYLEIFFFLSLLFWSYIKGFQPDIHGLEKFMDFGFMNSILRSEYMPPTDMWLPPHSINYYYFGHFVTAVLMKTTNISPFIAYNLMLASIFAFTTTSAFSIVSTLTNQVLKNKKATIAAGILGSILLSLGGNLQTIYSFFAPYTPPENPVPFWQLAFKPGSFPNSYWYPNATRFIPFTIHEFPSYSFVVSDLHGHVLDIPFVLLTIGLVFAFILNRKLDFKLTVLLAFLLAVMYMTNAWDGVLYFGLFSITVLALNFKILKFKKLKLKHYASFLLNGIHNKKDFFTSSLKYIGIAAIGYALFSLPFNLNFSPFVSGIGILCAPNFLTHIGKIGPLLFEADHCQRTPFWMFFILYTFFYLFAITLIYKIFNLKNKPYVFVFPLILIFFSTLLIIVPEFIYAKDIYPQHYRANTVFKLGYQAYIMLSLVTAFAIVYILKKGRKIIWIPITLVLLTLNLLYPYFAVYSYFGELKVYKGLDGLSYLKDIYPDDYDAIHWIQKNIKGQPVILESQGDSYTDYGRISSNTGLPTVLGWTVHEWLWRGDYSIPAARLDDVRALYEDDLNKTRDLISKYDIKYVYVGQLERTKYTLLNENKFEILGKVIYEKGTVRIYELN